VLVIGFVNDAGLLGFAVCAANQVPVCYGGFAVSFGVLVVLVRQAALVFFDGKFAVGPRVRQALDVLLCALTEVGIRSI